MIWQWLDINLVIRTFRMLIQWPLSSESFCLMGYFEISRKSMGFPLAVSHSNWTWLNTLAHIFFISASLSYLFSFGLFYSHSSFLLIACFDNIFGSKPGFCHAACDAQRNSIACQSERESEIKITNLIANTSSTMLTNRYIIYWYTHSRDVYRHKFIALRACIFFSSRDLDLVEHVMRNIGKQISRCVFLFDNF